MKSCTKIAAVDPQCFPENASALPRLELPAGAEFPAECLDFERGIRVGNLKPKERITRILKSSLEAGFRQTFTTVRWGRGVHWLWIGFFPKADRLAKPRSSHVNFGCAKYFISLEPDERIFKAGMQVERGFIRAPLRYADCRLRSDWDWHRLIRQLKGGSEVEEELFRLNGEDGFEIFAGSWEKGKKLAGGGFKGARQLSRLLSGSPDSAWCGFQVYYPFTRKAIREMSGTEASEAILAVFAEVTPLMERCLQTPLVTEAVNPSLPQKE
jgi:hypothetical protein